MGVYAKGLLIAAILASFAASVLVVSTGAALFATPWSVWIAAGLFVGGVLTGAVYSSVGAARPLDPLRASLTPAPASVATASSPQAPGPTGGATCFSDQAFLAFIEQLMAAMTSDELQSTVQAELPPLIGGRKVWMVSDSQQRTAIVEASVPERRPDLQLVTDVQEWTIFPLRLNDQAMGRLGVESAGGLGADLRATIQRITVLLARALGRMDAIETLREAGLVDLLTGAATRREGFNRLHSEVKRAQRTGAAMAVVMIDLDHFKSVNDRFGHAVGDALLTAIGRTLQSTLRASDVRSRWGGEEFLIALPDSDLSRGQVVAMHLLQNIAATHVQTPSGPVTTTASIGVTISGPGETSIGNLVARADLALYRAKREGRSCVRVVLGDHDGKAIAAEADASLPFRTETGPPTPPVRSRPLTTAERCSLASNNRRGAPARGWKKLASAKFSR